MVIGHQRVLATFHNACFVTSVMGSADACHAPIRNPEARTRVVEAAWRVVAAEGVHGATMRADRRRGRGHDRVRHPLLRRQAGSCSPRSCATTTCARGERVAGRDRRAAAGSSRSRARSRRCCRSTRIAAASGRSGVACWGPTAPGERPTEELRGGRRFVERLLAELLEQAVEDGELPDDGGRRLRGRAPGDADRRHRHAGRRRVAGSGSGATPSGCSPSRSRAWRRTTTNGRGSRDDGEPTASTAR